ncbi:hypothetical protein CXG81DRAFT_14104 [Caulochytrium protostelioides]|uniref:poly(A)-specific ribonuclease n=1 Tax=Caulochytrium protostelioides TaxID=1555241 RepID=A0A4P9X3X2_9FUNG|nr:hypothetical protein CXG81DRAFT_14104 [Caulochytrium protostelioides]|eukprot:RKO99749.1 hypothetical protein CXG81DRAFT_14104 [Caulochytrium protostelioides]
MGAHQSHHSQHPTPPPHHHLHHHPQHHHPHPTSLHHQKQLELALQSRQAGTPHYHARIAAVAARTGAPGPGLAAFSGGTQAGSPHGGSMTSLSGSREMSLGSNHNNSNNHHEPRPSQWRGLDMGGMAIKNLSPELFHYAFLTSLYLNHNQLAFLPPDIVHLRNLVILDLSSNKLAAVPPETGLLVHLRELLLFDNDISYLPPELGFLYQLETLGLEGNPLMEPFMSILISEGSTALITYLRENMLQTPPPPPRDWIVLDEDHQPPPNLVTVMCYNILSQSYAKQATYGYTPSWALAWPYRRELILQDIMTYHADILCLQEVEQQEFEKTLKPRLAALGNYAGAYLIKSRARTMTDQERPTIDGCAIFWNRDKYRLVDHHDVEFQQIAMQRPDFRSAEDVFNRVSIKDNVAVIALLERVGPGPGAGEQLIVANTHLHWHPAFNDVKLVQTSLLVDEIRHLARRWAKHPADNDEPPMPILICGDFNSLPDSGVYELLSKGGVPPTHPDFGSYKYGDLTASGMAHRLHLSSAYADMGEPDFTNLTPGFRGVIDYIWYSGSRLAVTGLLGNVPRGYAAKTPGFPSQHFPSDHIPLIASFVVKPDNSK